MSAWPQNGSVCIGNHSGIHLIEMFLYKQGQLSVITYEIGPEKVRQEVRARGGAIIKIKFARKISDGMLWNV